MLVPRYLPHVMFVLPEKMHTKQTQIMSEGFGRGFFTASLSRSNSVKRVHSLEDYIADLSKTNSTLVRSRAVKNIAPLLAGEAARQRCSHIWTQASDLFGKEHSASTRHACALLLVACVENDPDILQLTRLLTYYASIWDNWIENDPETELLLRSLCIITQNGHHIFNFQLAEKPLSALLLRFISEETISFITNCVTHEHSVLSQSVVEITEKVCDLYHTTKNRDVQFKCIEYLKVVTQYGTHTPQVCAVLCHGYATSPVFADYIIAFASNLCISDIWSCAGKDIQTSIGSIELVQRLPGLPPRFCETVYQQSENVQLRSHLVTILEVKMTLVNYDDWLGERGLLAAVRRALKSDSDRAHRFAERILDVYKIITFPMIEFLFDYGANVGEILDAVTDVPSVALLLAERVLESKDMPWDAKIRVLDMLCSSQQYTVVMAALRALTHPKVLSRFSDVIVDMCHVSDAEFKELMQFLDQGLSERKRSYGGFITTEYYSEDQLKYVTIGLCRITQRSQHEEVVSSLLCKISLYSMVHAPGVAITLLTHLEREKLHPDYKETWDDICLSYLNHPGDREVRESAWRNTYPTERHLSKITQLWLDQMQKSNHTSHEILISYVTRILGICEKLPKSDQDLIVTAIVARTSGDTVVSCIHTLTVCSYELPISIKKFLNPILTKLQTCKPCTCILEFLVSLVQIPGLTSNLQVEEFKRVFGIAFKMASYADIGTKACAYNLGLAHSTVTMWYISMRLIDRRKIFPFLASKITDVALLDLLQRFTYSQLNLRIVLPPHDLPDLSSNTWLFGNSIVSINTVVSTGVTQFIVRRASGTSSFHVTPDMSMIPVGDPDTDLFSANYMFLQMCCHDSDSQPILLPPDEGLYRSIANLDRIPVVNFHKVGVMYIGPGQIDEISILRNTDDDVSKDYHDFVSGLGHLVDLNSKNYYLGGLTTEDGNNAIGWYDKITMLIYHTATMMPLHDDDPQCTLKKRHIGNNYVNIFYNDSGLPFQFGILKSQFSFINIVITPFLDHYKVQLFKIHDLPTLSCISEFKIISRQHISSFVRNSAILCDTFAQIWTADSYKSTWARRQQQIELIRSKVQPSEGRDITTFT